MRNLFLLIWVQVVGLFNSSSNKRKRRLGNITGAGSVLFIFALMAFIFGSYTVSFVQVLQPVQGELLVMPLMLLLSALVIIVFTVSKVKDILLDFKDFDLLMSMPISRPTVIASRLGLLVVSNLIYSVSILLPAGVIIAVFTRPGPMYYISFVLTLLPAGLLPVAITSLLGALVSMLTARMKHKKAMGTFLMLLFPLAIMCLSFLFSSSFGQDPAMLASLFNTIRGSFFYLDWYYQALEGSVTALLAFLAVSLLPAALFCWWFSRSFLKLHAAAQLTGPKEGYRSSSLGVSSPLRALFQRELRMYVNTSAYFINTIFGPILMVLGVVAVCIMWPGLLERAEANPGLAPLLALLPPILPMALSTLVCMSSTTDSAISIEGKRFWLLKALPVSVRQIFRVKLGLNLLITAPVSLLCAVVLSIALKPGLYATLFMLVTPLVFSAFISLLGLVMNLVSHRLDWSNEVSVVKQSFPVMVCTLGGMVFGLGACTLAALLGYLGCLLITAAVAVLSVLLYLWLLKKGPARFMAID